MFLHKQQFKMFALEKLFPNWKKTKQYMVGDRFTNDNAESKGNNG